MFERFTERARQVVVLAQDEARQLRHDYIGTEHLLLGLLREEEGVAVRVLASFDITLEEVRAQVARIVGEGGAAPTGGMLPFTPRATRVLELSLREALKLQHNYIGTEHLLLALTQARDGVAVRILEDFDAPPERVFAEVAKQLGSDVPYEPASSVSLHVSREARPSTWWWLEFSPEMITGAALLGIGIFVGWLIWG